MPAVDEQPSFIEALARRIVPPPPPPQEGPQQCSRRELIQIMRPIERGVVLRGALAGALCGLATYWGVVTAEPLYIEASSDAPWWTNWAFYSASLGIAIFATLIEVVYLYYDAIRGALTLGQVAEQATHEPSPDPEALKTALIRAGLEIGDQTRPLYGIDPLQETSRWRLLVFTVAYKLKVTASNFILKMLVRRFAARTLGRSAGRSAVEMLAMPVFALWNAWVCRTIMVQARVRATGKPLIDEVFSLVFPHGVSAMPDHLQHACFLAIREQVVRAAGFHHNMILLAHRFVAEAKDSVIKQHEGAQNLGTCLKVLNADERAVVMEFFILLCALDGRVWRWEKRKLKILLNEVDLAPDAGRLKGYRRAVRKGYPLADVATGRLQFQGIKQHDASTD